MRFLPGRASKMYKVPALPSWGSPGPRAPSRVNRMVTPKQHASSADCDNSKVYTSDFTLSGGVGGRKSLRLAENWILFKDSHYYTSQPYIVFSDQQDWRGGIPKCPHGWRVVRQRKREMCKVSGEPAEILGDISGNRKPSTTHADRRKPPIPPSHSCAAAAGAKDAPELNGEIPSRNRMHSDNDRETENVGQISSSYSPPFSWLVSVWWRPCCS